MTVGPVPLHVVDSYEEASEILARYGDEARVLAGGQSLAVLLRLDLAQPAALVSLRRCPGATEVQRRPGIGITVGARCSVRAAEALGPDYESIRVAAGQVASPHVRNVGTVVGNVCHADPANDMAPALLCHDAEAVVRSVRGTRVVPLNELLDQPYDLAIEGDEFVQEIHVPALPGWSGAYRKLVWRSADHAIVTAAVAIRVIEGVVVDVRACLGAAVPAPYVMSGLIAALTGRSVHDNLSELVGCTVREEIGGLDLLGAGDTDVPVSYRRRVAPVVVADAFDAALASVREEGGR